MTILSRRLLTVRPSATKAVTAEARRLAAEGLPIIALSQGEPDFDTPEAVRAAGKRAIDEGRTRYTEVGGIAPLREAIAARFEHAHGLVYDPAAITVGAGAKQLLFNALLATLDEGDEVLIPTPSWPSYPEMVNLAGGRPRLLRCAAANGFKLDPDALDAAIGPRTKWLLVNSPSNPTGATYDRAELAAIAEVLRRHPHVWVLSDDIYGRLVYDVAFANLPAVDGELAARTLLVDGVSKSHAMTGWRLGYAAGPAELVRAMNTIQSQTTSHASSISQHAALAALAGDDGSVERFRETYRERRDYVSARVAAMPGLDCVVPAGAFYLFPSCRELLGRRTAGGSTIGGDADFAMYLLRDFHVAVVPGTAFDGPGHFRMSFASGMGDLSEACDRMAAACAALQA